MTGYLVTFGGAVVSWKSKKQVTVKRSYVEVEFRSMVLAVAEVTWLINVFKELGININFPIQMFCDSKVVIKIAINPIFHERTKHIDIDYHFVREKVLQGVIKTFHVSTKEQVANLLTKSLGKQPHNYLMSKLMLKDLFQPLV